MAVKVHGRKTQVYLNGIDLTSIFTNVDSTNTVDMAETTVFGVQDKEFLPGHRSGTSRLQGYFSKDADSSDPVLSALPGSETPAVLTVIRDTDVIELPTECSEALLSSYGRTSPIAGVVAVSADFQATEGLFATRTLFPKGSKIPTVAGGTTAEYNGGDDTVNGAIGYLHVFARTGSPVILIEHSDDGSSGWETLITFAAAAAVGAQAVAVSGAVKPFLRTTSSGGTATAWVGIYQPV